MQESRQFDPFSYYFRNKSYLIIALLIPILYYSTVLIKEFSDPLYHKQIGYYMIAFIVYIVASFVPWKYVFWWFGPIAYGFNLLLLLAVEVAGKTVLGAKRWLSIPGIHLTIQPSELTKVAVIFMLAFLIERKPPGPRGYGFKDFMLLIAVILVPFLLIAKEPDLGTALVLMIAGVGILFVIGVNWKIWTVIAIVLGVSAPFLYKYGLKPYQKVRIHDALNKPSYQVRQALIAIGSGGLEGQSQEKATQTHNRFLPVASTDFIFAFLGERYGLKGILIVIFAYIALILYLLYLAYSNSHNPLLQIFASGVAFLFFVYMGVNIFMVIGLAPVVGLPLPMFSHGGTSFIIFALLLGILQHLIAFKDNESYNSSAKVFFDDKELPLINKRISWNQS